MTNFFLYCTSSTAQGGGGSFKNRKPIGEIGCCESRMAERSQWWTERWLRSPLSLSFFLSFFVSFFLSSFFPWLSTYLPTYLCIYVSICLSVWSIYLSIYLAYKFPGNFKPILGNESIVSLWRKRHCFQNAQNAGAVFPPTGFTVLRCHGAFPSGRCLLSSSSRSRRSRSSSSRRKK